MSVSRPGPRIGFLLAVAAGVGRDVAAQAVDPPAKPAPRPASTPAITPGTRVRAEAPALGPGRATWVVSIVRGDTMLLLPTGTGGRPPVAVAFADVTHLEVNRGARRNALLGAAAGLILGATAGALYGASHPDPYSGLECVLLCTEEQYRQSQRPAPRYWATTGATLGAPLGALVGRFIVGDHWQRVVAGPARLSVAPGAAGGVRVALSAPAR